MGLLSGLKSLAGSISIDFVTDSRVDSHGSRIELVPDKESYMSGEEITGVVRVFCRHPIDASAVMLKVTGKEKVYFEKVLYRTEGEGEDERRIPYVKQFANKREIYKDRVTLASLPGTLAPGTHEYRFAWRLPAGLPSAFRYRDSQLNRETNRNLRTEGEILYKIKATLDKNGFFSKDINSKRELVVTPNITGLDMAPASGQKTGSVMFCCCINKGEVDLKCFFDKASYFEGETAMVTAEINNRSEVDINRMVVKLMRDMRFQGQGDYYMDVDCILESSFDPVKAGEQKVIPMTLPLTGRLVPTTEGQIVSCKYRFEVECDISWCPDVEVHLPTRIFPRPRYSVAATSTPAPVAAAPLVMPVPVPVVQPVVVQQPGMVVQAPGVVVAPNPLAAPAAVAPGQVTMVVGGPGAAAGAPAGMTMTMAVAPGVPPQEGTAPAGMTMTVTAPAVAAEPAPAPAAAEPAPTAGGAFVKGIDLDGDGVPDMMVPATPEQ